MQHYNTRSVDRKDTIADSFDAFALEMAELECVEREKALSPLERSQIEAFDAMLDDLFSDDDDAEIADDVICKSATDPVQEKPTLSSPLHNVIDIRATPCSVARLTSPTSPSLVAP